MSYRRITLFLLLAWLPGLHAQEYLVAHAPQNQQWSSDIYFRTQLPDTTVSLQGYVIDGGTGNGPGQLAWTSEALLLPRANSLISPADFQGLIDGRGYDFLIVQEERHRAFHHDGGFHRPAALIDAAHGLRQARIAGPRAK